MPNASDEATPRRPIVSCAPNFRDIGGYRTMDGRAVRTGQLFRSQVIAAPTASDLDVLRELDIRYVCDLRGTRERKSTPDAWPNGPTPELRHLDIGVDVRAGAERLVELIVADPTPRGVHAMMVLNYSLLPQAFVGRFSLFLDDILAGERLPAVIHCTAGKDRTGFMSALLLLSLRVPMEGVMRDYGLTDRFTNIGQMMTMSRFYLKTIVGADFEPADDMLEVLCRTSPAYLESALGAIEADYGSPENYLEQTAGLDAAKRARLRELMLE